MYRLLIVTENPAVQDMIAAMDGWEAMGFKPPRVRRSEAEAVECMHKHHIDAIAVEPSVAFDGLMTYLDEHYPNLPLFRIADTAEGQREVVREVYQLLNRIRADDTNDEYDDDARMELQRERWMKKLISGMIATADDMERQLRLYRCREQMQVPCVLARLQLPEDESFLEERWHYGSDRLEVALRNFFGREYRRMRLHVVVVSTEEIRVLCYPASAAEGVSENAAFEYVQETAEQIDHYLGLSLRVMDVRRLSGLDAFAADHNAL